MYRPLVKTALSGTPLRPMINRSTLLGAKIRNLSSFKPSQHTKMSQCIRIIGNSYVKPIILGQSRSVIGSCRMISSSAVRSAKNEPGDSESTEKDAANKPINNAGKETKSAESRDGGAKTNAVQKFDEDEYDDYYDEPKTAKEKVKACKMLWDRSLSARYNSKIATPC